MAQTRIPKTQLDITIVDTTSTQTVSGAKTFSNALTAFGNKVTITGANGTLTLFADTDGGDLNLSSANGNQTLAIYGSGANTLNVNLLDGVLQTGSATRLDGTGTLTNVTLDSAGTGNSLKVNGTGLTSITGTGSVVLATSPTLVTPTIGVATATSINKITITAPTTSATLTLVTGSSLITAGAFALTLTSTATTNSTLPAGTDTLLGRASTDTITGVKTFGAAGNVGKLVVAGTTSGTLTLAATAVSGTVTATFPAITGTVAMIGSTIGYITGAQITANFTSTTTTLTAVTGLSVTFTANGVSRYKVTVYARDIFVSGGGVADLTLWLTAVSTGTQVQGAEPNTPSGSAVPVTLVYYTTTAPAAGSVTYAVGLKGATNTAVLEASTVAPAYIMVEAF